MSTDWDIKSRGDTCAKSGEAFADNQRYVSRLVFGIEGYVREDFAEENWDESMAEGALSVWRSVFRMPPPAPEEALKKETAESLIRQFMEDEDVTRTNAIYILAVMLERRRIFAERDVQVRDDGVKVRIYEHKKTGETFLVPDPELRLAELEQVQEEVVALLGGKRPGSKDVPPGESSSEPVSPAAK
jgi:hypothetical protein